jgi:hypothetical protein
VFSFTPQPLYPQRNRPQYPLDRRLGGPQVQSGCYGEKKIPAIQPVSILNELSWLSLILCITQFKKDAPNYREQEKIILSLQKNYKAFFCFPPLFCVKFIPKLFVCRDLKYLFK